MKRDRLTEYAIELQSLAQAGLHYGKDIYDRERYERIREIAAEIISMKTKLPLDTVTGMFCSDSGYQTPKVDTRSAIFRDGKILLVHEANGTWSLPGGWCEVTMSPAENAVKETKEEAGARRRGEVGHRRAEPRFSQSSALRIRRGQDILPLRRARRRICRKLGDRRDRLL